LSRVLEVQGTLDYTGTNFRFGPTTTPGVVHIVSGATFNTVGEGDFGYYYSGAHEILNEGTFIRSGAGTTTVGSSIAFNTSGTVEVQAGTLQLSGGGAQSGTLLGPGLMEFTGGTHTLEGLSGTADLKISSGTVQVSGDGVDISGTTFLTGGTLSVGSTYRTDRGSMSGGTLTGAGTVTIDEAFTWTAGSMTGGGLVVVGPEATFTASGGGTKDLSRVLEVQGTLDYTGTNFRFGPTTTPGVVHIVSGATFNTVGEGDFGYYYSGAHEILNEGTFIRSGAGTTTVGSSIAFNTSGTVEVQAGTLQLSGGGAQSGTLAGPGLMEITGGTHTLEGLSGTADLKISSGTVQVSGDGVDISGTTFLTGGTLSVGSTYRTDRGSMSGGTLTGAGTVTIDEAFTWTAGSMTGGGLVVVGPEATFTASGGGTKDLSRVLEVQGTLDYTGTNFRFGPTTTPGVVHIVSGATFNAVGEGDFGVYYSGSPCDCERGELHPFGDGDDDGWQQHCLQHQRDGGGAGGDASDIGAAYPKWNHRSGIGCCFSADRGLYEQRHAKRRRHNKRRFRQLPYQLGHHCTGVATGDRTGMLYISGNLNQGPEGIIAVEIDGGTKEDFDILAISGTASLGGTLRVSGIGDEGTFSVLNASAISGVFSNVVEAGGFMVTEQYSDTAVTVSIAFSVVSWTGGGGNDLWTNTANWDAGRLPGPTDKVFIDVAGANPTIVLSSGTHSIRSLTSYENLSISSATLNIAADSFIQAGARLFVESGTLGGTGTLVNFGTVDLRNGTISAGLENQGDISVYISTGTISGQLSNRSSGRIFVTAGGNAYQNATLTVEEGFTNEGLIQLSRAYMNTARLTVTSGTLTNAASGILRGAGTSGNNDFNAVISNLGLIDALQSTQITNSDRIFDNSNGTIQVAEGQTLTVSGGSTVFGSGTVLTGAGNIAFPGTQSIDLSSDWTYAAGSAGLNLSGTVTINGPGTLINEGSISLTGDTIASALENLGTISVYINTGTISGQLSNRSSGRIFVTAGGSAYQNATLTVEEGFTNEGLIQLSRAYMNTARLTVTSGTLTNAASGILRGAGTSGNNDFNAVISNLGLIDALQSTQITNSDRVFDNSNGTIQVAEGQTLTVSGGSTVFGSGTVLTGAGNIAFPGTQSIDLSSDWTYAAGSAGLNLSGTVTINGPGTLINEGSISLTGDTIASALENLGTISVYINTGTISGQLSNRSSGRIFVTAGGSAYQNATLTVEEGFTNEGLIQLSRAYMNTARLTVTSGTLTNAASGILRGAGTSGNNDFNAVISNLGLIDALQSTQITNSDRVFDNSNGTIQVAEGQTLTVSGGSTVFGSGTVLTGAGNIAFPGTQSIDLSSDWTYAAGSAGLNLSGTVTINGPGTLINEGSISLTGDTIASALENLGTISVYINTGTISGQLSNRSSGRIFVTAGGSAYQNATLTVEEGFTNEGLDSTEPGVHEHGAADGDERHADECGKRHPARSRNQREQ
jgi:RNase P/RNase MRP subunit POP5